MCQREVPGLEGQHLWWTRRHPRFPSWMGPYQPDACTLQCPALDCKLGNKGNRGSEDAQMLNMMLIPINKYTNFIWQHLSYIKSHVGRDLVFCEIIIKPIKNNSVFIPLRITVTDTTTSTTNNCIVANILYITLKNPVKSLSQSLHFHLFIKFNPVVSG